MTRIITIASGLDQVGKTHLGINMALELVRRGHHVGYYHERGGRLPVNQLLQLPPQSLSRHASEKGDVLCLGYQGVDVISSRLSLSHWNGLDQELLDSVIAAHAAWTDYDDFLIDTSGVSPRGVVACCKLSALVLLVVTPDPRSQAEAFALLKVLRLNDFEQQVCLIINKVDTNTDVNGIHARLATRAREYLQLELPLPGTVVNARQVLLAQHIRQAFTSVFPDSEAAGQVVELVGALEGIRETAAPESATLPVFWKTLAGSLRRPVHLAGNINLAEYEQPEPLTPAAAPNADSRQQATVLRFEGPLEQLDNVMQGFSAVMHFIADDMQAFHQRLAELATCPELAGAGFVPDSRGLESTLATILRVLRVSRDKREQVSFRVEETPVNGQDENWLRAGHYIKYLFIVPGHEGDIDRVSRELERIPDLRHSKGQDGECICEALSTARDACLSVIHTPRDKIRVHYWHLPDNVKELQVNHPARVAAGTGTLDHHPEHTLLH